MWEKYKKLWKNAGKNLEATFSAPHKSQSKLNVLGARVLAFCAIISIFFIIGLLLFPFDVKDSKEISADNKKPGWLLIILTAIFAAPFGIIASVIFICDKFAK